MGLGSVSYPWSATSTTGSSFVYLIHWVCRVYPLGVVVDSLVSEYGGWDFIQLGVSAYI